MTDGTGHRILLVEDETGIGLRLANSLGAVGYLVSWHRTGLGALEEATQVPFDLVLLDLGLPDSDGVEICRDLRACQPASLIVMLTARRDEMDVVVGLEAGADDYITKPFGLAPLLTRIRFLLEGPSKGWVDDFVIREGPYNWE